MARPRWTVLNATPLAKQYHSIVFDDTYNTYENHDADSEYSWHLIPSTRPVFNPPEQKIITADKAGSHGVIDLSEALSGEPVFNNRTGSIEFYVENDHGSWAAKMSKISNVLNGRVRKAVLTDDPAYYYYGRFRVNNWKSDKWWSVITIDYDVFPFKYDITEANESWLWDPFSFETGVIHEIPGHVGYWDSKHTTYVESPVRQYFGFTCPGYSASGENLTESNYRLVYNHTQGSTSCDTYFKVIGSPLSVVPEFVPTAECQMWFYDDWKNVPSSKKGTYIGPFSLSANGINVVPEVVIRNAEQGICIRNTTTTDIHVFVGYRGGSL